MELGKIGDFSKEGLMILALFPIKKGGDGGGSVAMKNYFKRFWNDETGQTTTEYILILAIVVMIAMKFKKEFTSKMTDIVGKVGNQIESAADTN